MRHAFSRRLWSRLIAAWLAALPAGAAPGAEGWLTPSERAFFEAFGVDAVVDGKPVRRPADLARLPDIARDAEPELRRSIETILESHQTMRVTPAERAEFAAIQQQAIAQLRLGMSMGMIRMLLGEDPWDESVRVADGVMKQGRIADAWDLQARWLERALRAQAEADAALGAITGRLGERLGPPRPTSDLALRVDLVSRRFQVVGGAGPRPLTDPVVQVVLHRNPTGGRLVGMALAGAALTRAMGIEGMSFDAVLKGGRLAGAQELARDYPLTSTQLLTPVGPGRRLAVRINLAPGEILALERVELRVWGAEGWFTIDALPGLDVAKRKVIELAAKDRQAKLARAREQARRRALRAQNERAKRQLDHLIGQGINRAQQQNGINQQLLQDQFNRGLRSGRP